MSQVINTNIASLNAQRNLNTSQSQLNVSLERLSSGLRINSAKDDAAGLAISERFSAQINGNNQAARNANDGISLAQTAEGALEEIGNIAQRIRELAVQSANDTNSSSDRAALNQEVEQLVAEAGRIAESTQFNDQNVLDGTLEDIIFQVGANQGQTISVDGVDARADQLGAAVFGGDAIDLAGLVDGSALAETELTLNGAEIDLSEVNVEDGFADLDAVVAAINAESGDSGVEAQRSAEVEATIDVGALSEGSDLNFTLNGATISVETDSNEDVSGQVLADRINEAGISGVSATFDEDENDVVITGEGADLQFVQGDDSTGFNVVSSDETGDVTSELGSSAEATAGIARGIELIGEVGETVDVEGDAADNLGIDALGDPDERTLQSVDISSREDASEAIGTMDFVLGQVNSLRADLGAVQNRFESTVSNLNVTTENLEASRSRILDADFAQETANLTRGQILQQAGTSVLAQANQIPNNVLGLLQ